MSTVLDVIGEKLAAGGAPDQADAQALWDSPDLVRLGMLGDEARRKRHGDRTTYVRVLDVAVDAAASVEIPPSVGEIRVVGPVKAVDLYFDGIAALVARAGDVPVTACVLEEAEAALGSGGDALRRWLERLRQIGVAGIGSAAVDRLVTPDVTVGEVVDAGLTVARFVVQDANEAGPWNGLARLQAIGAAIGEVRAFAPLPRAQDPARPTTGYWDAKTIALARLVLADVESIQVDWSLHGPKLAQVALLFGADDLDAVSVVYDTGMGRRRAPLEDVRRNIVAASQKPVQRNALWQVID